MFGMCNRVTRLSKLPLGQSRREPGTGANGVFLELIEGRDPRGRGAGALVLLISLAAIGALVAIVVVALPVGEIDNQHVLPYTSLAPGRPKAPPQRPSFSSGGDTAQAAIAACQADYGAVEGALGYYEAEKGGPPSTISSLRFWLRDPITSPYFSIAIVPNDPGLVEVGTKGHPLADGNGNCLYAG
jgi:hypothetical protein